jgi:hypothetical protein
MAAPLIAAVVVVGLTRIVKRLVARRRVRDAAVWQRAFTESGGSVVKFPGYDRAQQAKAVSQVRAAERRQLQQLKAKTRPTTPATVVRIDQRKAAR